MCVLYIDCYTVGAPLALPVLSDSLKRISAQQWHGFPALIIGYWLNSHSECCCGSTHTQLHKSKGDTNKLCLWPNTQWTARHIVKHMSCHFCAWCRVGQTWNRFLKVKWFRIGTCLVSGCLVHQLSALPAFVYMKASCCCAPPYFNKCGQNALRSPHNVMQFREGLRLS